MYPLYNKSTSRVFTKAPTLPLFTHILLWQQQRVKESSHCGTPDAVIMMLIPLWTKNPIELQHKKNGRFRFSSVEGNLLRPWAATVASRSNNPLHWLWVLTAAVAGLRVPSTADPRRFQVPRTTATSFESRRLLPHAGFESHRPLQPEATYLRSYPSWWLIDPYWKMSSNEKNSRGFVQNYYDV